MNALAQVTRKISSGYFSSFVTKIKYLINAVLETRVNCRGNVAM